MSFCRLSSEPLRDCADSGDWDATYHYFWDDWQMIEVRNGSDELLKQYVWGLGYIDELIQIGLPCTEEDIVGYRFCLCQDANYNVLGVVKPQRP